MTSQIFLCVTVIQFGWLLFSSKLDEISIICKSGFQNVFTYVWHNVSLVYKHTNTVKEIKHKHQLFFYYWNICQHILCCISSMLKGLSHEVIQRHTISDTQQEMLVPWHLSNHKPVTMQRQKENKTQLIWGQLNTDPKAPGTLLVTYRVMLGIVGGLCGWTGPLNMPQVPLWIRVILFID